MKMEKLLKKRINDDYKKALLQTSAEWISFYYLQHAIKKETFLTTTDFLLVSVHKQAFIDDFLHRRIQRLVFLTVEDGLQSNDEELISYIRKHRLLQKDDSMWSDVFLKKVSFHVYESVVKGTYLEKELLHELLNDIKDIKMNYLLSKGMKKAAPIYQKEKDEKELAENTWEKMKSLYYTTYGYPFRGNKIGETVYKTHMKPIIEELIQSKDISEDDLDMLIKIKPQAFSQSVKRELKK